MGLNETKPVGIKYDRKKPEQLRYVMEFLSKNIPNQEVIVDFRGYAKVFPGEKAPLAILVNALKSMPKYYTTKMTILVDNSAVENDFRNTTFGKLEKLVDIKLVNKD